MYDQKENTNRHNHLQANHRDLSKLTLKCSYQWSASSEDKGALLGWKKQNFMEILKKQSVISRLTQGDGFDETSLGRSNINLDVEKDALKILKLPSIEYIVQDNERKLVQNALFRDKIMKLSDFCENHSPFTSREELTEKKLDFSKHQKTKANTQQYSAEDNSQFANNLDKLQDQNHQQFSFHALTRKEFQEFKMNNNNQEQFEKIVDLQIQNKKLQKLYQILNQSESLNDIKAKISGSDLGILKRLIQGMQIFL